MPEHLGRTYPRELLLEYMHAQTPEDLRHFIATLIHKLKRKIRKEYRDKAADYVHTAIHDICNPDLPPLSLERELDLTGLFLHRAFLAFLRDLRESKREQALATLQIFEQAAGAQQQNLPQSEFSQIHGSSDGFPERKWSELLKNLEKLDKADRAVVLAALQNDCFRVGPKRVQFKNQMIAEILNKPIDDVARSIERIRGLFESLSKSKEEER